MKCEKEGILKFLPHCLRPAIRNFKVLNGRYGHFKTVWTRKCVDARGEPLPWYTYPAIEYVKQLDLRDRVIFEYGSGYSTIFYARRCRQIISVEDNRRWWETIRQQVPANGQILLAETPVEYVNAILKTETLFDIIIIDGSHRDQCLRLAPQKLKPDGLIIMDNSDACVGCAEILRAGDYLQVDMAGFGPLNGYVWATSFFFKRGFAIKSLFPHQPTLSVGP